MRSTVVLQVPLEALKRQTRTNGYDLARMYVSDWATGSRTPRIRLSGVTSGTWDTAFVVRQTAPVQLSLFYYLVHHN